MEKILNTRSILLFIALYFGSLAGCLAQQLWTSHNDRYIDDLPFTQDGDLIFSEVIPAPGSTAEDLYLLFYFRSYPSEMGWKPPYVIKKEASKGYLFYEDELYEVTTMEKLEFQDNQVKYSLKIVDFPYQTNPKKVSYAAVPHSLSYYFEKSNYIDSKSGKAKEENKKVKEALLKSFDGRTARLKKLDFKTILAKSNSWKDEEKENNWRSQMADMPQQAPFDTYLYPSLTEGLRTALVYKGVIHNSLDKAGQIKRLLRYMDVESGYEGWMGSDAEGMIYDVKDQLFVDVYLDRTYYWTLKLIPETGGCRYEFLVTGIEEMSPKNIYKSTTRDPAEYVRYSRENGKDKRVEEVLGECNAFADKLLKKFSVVFTTDVEDRASWNVGEKEKDWKGQNASFPQSLPFDKNGIMQYGGAVAAEGDAERQYEQFKKFVKENYVPLSDNVPVEIMNEKSEKESIALPTKATATSNYLDNVELILRFESTQAVKFQGAFGKKRFNDIGFMYTAIFTFGKGKCKYAFIVNKIKKEKTGIDLSISVVEKTAAEYFKNKSDSKVEFEAKLLEENFNLLLESLKAHMGVRLPSEKKKDDW